MGSIYFFNSPLAAATVTTAAAARATKTKREGGGAQKNKEEGGNAKNTIGGGDGDNGKKREGEKAFSIGATIRIGQEILCLLYAGLLKVKICNISTF